MWLDVRETVVGVILVWDHGLQEWGVGCGEFCDGLGDQGIQGGGGRGPSISVVSTRQSGGARCKVVWSCQLTVAQLWTGFRALAMVKPSICPLFAVLVQ